MVPCDARRLADPCTTRSAVPSPFRSAAATLSVWFPPLQTTAQRAVTGNPALPEPGSASAAQPDPAARPPEEDVTALPWGGVSSFDEQAESNPAQTTITHARLTNLLDARLHTSTTTSGSFTPTLYRPGGDDGRPDRHRDSMAGRQRHLQQHQAPHRVVVGVVDAHDEAAPDTAGEVTIPKESARSLLGSDTCGRAHPRPQQRPGRGICSHTRPAAPVPFAGARPARRDRIHASGSRPQPRAPPTATSSSSTSFPAPTAVSCCTPLRNGTSPTSSSSSCNSQGYQRLRRTLTHHRRAPRRWGAVAVRASGADLR